MRKIQDNSGFTLIELMIVVVIIGILAAIAIPRFTEVSDQAKQAEANPILKQMCSLAEAEYLKEGAWPDSEDDIPGWEAPASPKHFTDFAFAGGTATATAGDTGAEDASMECESKVVTVGGGAG